MNLNNKENEVNLSISLKNLEINIGTRKITIKDRFTLILGKFKRDLFKEYQNQEFLQVIVGFLILIRISNKRKSGD